MKTPYIFSPIALGIVTMVWISASGGVADVQNKDRTGSPISDVACTQCHVAGASFSTSALIQISKPSGAIVTEYIPGETYNLKLTIQSTGSSVEGFQIGGFLDDNSKAGTCSTITPNTQITPLNGRWYFEPTKAVSNGVYEMNWTAPVAGSGTVTFYGSALAGNGNGTTKGDQYVNIPNVVLSEGTTTSTLEIANNMEINMFPNPTSDVLQINSSTLVSRVEVLDLLGRKVMSESFNELHIQLNVSSLVKGNYMISVFGLGSEVSHKMMVKK